MIRFLYADQLADYPKLLATMFKDRADQFHTRLGWEVTVDENGEERDEYDDLNPLYVIWERPDGTHGGSMRLLPTTGRTMVNEHFTDIIGGGTIESPLIWECTRFCLARETCPGTAAALMLAGGEIMKNMNVSHYVGVFDARMVRIYKRIGSSPEVLGSMGEGRSRISVGLWEFTPEAQAKVAASAGISPYTIRKWFEHSFGSAPTALRMVG